MRRLLGILCIPIAIVGFFLLHAAEMDSPFVLPWLNEAFCGAFLLIGALLIISASIRAKQRLESQRHRELLRAVKNNPGVPQANAEDQLKRARSLIEQKQYGQARLLLKKIDHPTAHKWLVKLDEMQV